MKKSNFIALILGTVSATVFSLGMCMALIPEWNAFFPGIVPGCTGLALGLFTLLLWRKMEHKAPIRISGRSALTILVSGIGTLTFGAGMCLCMLWENIVLGTVVGLAGLLVLLCLIPMTRGIRD